MPEARKKPCRICQRWFYPDPRVGKRQRACGNSDCQTARREKTQASWRARNPSYAGAYRIDQRQDQDPPAEPLRVPAPLDKLPWDLAKDQFGPQGADFMGVMCLLLVRLTKDQSSRYPIEPNRVADNNPPSAQKTRPQPAHTETREASTGISPTGPPPGTPPGPPPGQPTPADRFAG